VNDCIEIFEGNVAFANGAPPQNLVDAIYAECEAMRSRGMGLEPNLVGRAVPILIKDRIDAGQITTRFAERDTDANAIIDAIGALSREHDLPEIEYGLYRVLQFYPRHPALLIQYAHSIKDQGKPSVALEIYLEAFGLGAPLADLEEHALFVADSIGIRDRVAKKLRDPRSICSFIDVKALALLLLGTDRPDKSLLDLVLENTDVASIMLALTSTDSFCNANGNFLRYLAETDRSLGDV